MTQVRVIGFIDVEEKPAMRPERTIRGQIVDKVDFIVRFRPEDVVLVDYDMMFNQAWRNGMRSTCRAKGYYPSGKQGSLDGGRFDLVYIMVELLPHMIGGAPIDNRKSQEG